jgi:hypothetical protein
VKANWVKLTGFKELDKVLTKLSAEEDRKSVV